MGDQLVTISDIRTANRSLLAAMKRKKAALDRYRQAEKEEKETRRHLKMLLDAAGQVPERPDERPPCPECGERLGTNAHCMECQAALEGVKG